METFSALLAICAGNSPVPSEFSAQRPVTRSFDVFFDLRLNKRLSKQSWGWWFATLPCPSWRHCNGSRPWSWMIDSHPFRPPIPEIRLFQTLTLKLQCQGHGCGQRPRLYKSAQYLLDFFSCHTNQITIPEIQLFQNLTLKNPRSMSWVRSKINVT